MQRSKKRFWAILFAVALMVFIAVAVAIGVLLFTYTQEQQRYDDLVAEVFSAPDASGTDAVQAEQDAQDYLPLSDFHIDWDALVSENPDTVGWIYIPDTPVNYPIVHTDSDTYYLTHSFEASGENRSFFGTIFLAAGNNADFSDKNNILYGHHMRNGSMFALIAAMADQSVFDAHRTVYILTPEVNYRLCTYSLVHCASDDPIAQFAFEDDESYSAYIQDTIEYSEVQAGEVPQAETIHKTFAFSTCDELTSKGRYVLFAYVAESTAETL